MVVMYEFKVSDFNKVVDGASMNLFFFELGCRIGYRCDEYEESVQLRENIGQWLESNSIPIEDVKMKWRRYNDNVICSINFSDECDAMMFKMKWL